MDKNSKSQQKTSTFAALKYAGEHFFENHQILAEVKKQSNEICIDYRQQFGKISSSRERKAFLYELLFQTIQFKKSRPIEFERRNEITLEEERLIKEACKSKGISDNNETIENIKFALGYKTKDATYKKPCVAVVGQTKAGKSSLINCILQERIVPQKQSRQTARVTYVTHCTTKFVAYMERHNFSTSQAKLRSIEVGVDVQDKDVDLKLEKRSNKSEISVEIRVGTPNSIVGNGFDIVDSPGLNENPALNELCAKMEKSILPLLIYVVEGRNGLTQTDIDDIKQIRQHASELKIIYFVTKLARSKYDRIKYERKKIQKGLKLHEDISGESDTEVALRRVRNVLSKMKREAFLAPSTELTNQGDCNSRDFHGADIWAVNDLRIHEPNKQATDCDLLNLKLINWFEESLMLYLKNMLESPLKEEIQYTPTPLEDILEKATSAASDIHTEKSDKLACLKLFRQSELSYYEEELNYIKTTLRDAINKLITDCKPLLLEIIDSIDESTTRSHRTMSSMDDSSNSERLLSSFVMEVRKKIESSLDEEIRKFVEEFMFKREDRLRKNLCRILGKLTSGNYGSRSFEVMLRNRLVYEYDLYDHFESSMADISTEINEIRSVSWNSNRVKRIVHLVKTKGSFTAGLFKRRNATPTAAAASATDDDAEYETDLREMDAISADQAGWKLKLAEKVLNDFDKEEFMKVICNIVTEDFNKGHESFVKQLDQQEKFLEDKLIVGDAEKNCVRSFSEQLGIQFARVFHVKTRVEVMIDPMRPPIKIKEGGQANVEKAFIVGKMNPVVVKHYKQCFVDFEKSDRMKNIAMEIYYSSRLTHSRCLKLFGIHFDETEKGWKFSALYPYLEMGTVKGYIRKLAVPTNEIELRHQLKERMEFCIEVAEGIQFLHQLQITHRDINLKNILVRPASQQSQSDGSKVSKFEAVISDYGLLKSFGFIERTYKVGTLLYMAPELLNEKGLSKDSYTSAVDVFSFALCSWQLLSCNLSSNYKYYPKFAIECEFDEAGIEKAVIEGRRPEERSLLPKSMTKLLERCWAGNPYQRPSFIKKLEELPGDIDPNDEMIGKTIVDELKRIFIEF